MINDILTSRIALENLIQIFTWNLGSFTYVPTIKNVGFSVRKDKSLTLRYYSPKNKISTMVWSPLLRRLGWEDFESESIGSSLRKPCLDNHKTTHNADFDYLPGVILLNLESEILKQIRADIIGLNMN